MYFSSYSDFMQRLSCLYDCNHLCFRSIPALSVSCFLPGVHSSRLFLCDRVGPAVKDWQMRSVLSCATIYISSYLSLSHLPRCVLERFLCVYCSSWQHQTSLPSYHWKRSPARTAFSCTIMLFYLSHVDKPPLSPPPTSPLPAYTFLGRRRNASTATYRLILRRTMKRTKTLRSLRQAAPSKTLQSSQPLKS